MARTKGARNKHTFEVDELAQRFAMSPFEILMHMAHNNWKELGYDNEYFFTEQTEGEGRAIKMDPVISPNVRLNAAKEAAKYIHSPKQAVDPKTGDAAITIRVVDYTKK